MLADIGGWLLKAGGTLAVLVSGGILVSLVARPTASINALNLATLVLASAGGLCAIYYSTRARGMIATNILLLLAVAPTVFGWIWLLYVAPIVLAVAGTVLRLSFSSRVNDPS